MRCLVTGGCGFIGSHLVDKLIDRGYSVVVLDNLSTGKIENLNPIAAFYNEDVTNLKSIKKYFKNIDYVFHLAALPRIQPSFEQPVEHEDVNVIGTINCLMASRDNEIKKFIFAGSSSCYGNTKEIPTSETASVDCLNPYALQKYTAEQYCLILGKRYGISVNSVRYFNPYGPRSFNPKNPLNAYSSVVGIFNNQAKTTGILTITGDGEQSRDFIHVYDLAEATVLAAEKDVEGEVFNVGYGESYTINYLSSLFNCKIAHTPERQGESEITLANIDKAKKLLGWKPEISLFEGIKKYEI